MKEYCTLVTTDISSWVADLRFSSRETAPPGDPVEGQLQTLMGQGWVVIDATSIPKLSTDYSYDVRFAFVLEREMP